ncbi:MAG: hypothetical protein JNK78_01670 [Planctomycetes bacterium]|nr:hypothetical protein [Planctomycetota bacterium]
MSARARQVADPRAGAASAPQEACHIRDTPFRQGNGGTRWIDSVPRALEKRRADEMRTLLVLMTLFCSFLTAQDRPRAGRPDGEPPMRRELRAELRERWLQRQGQRGERLPLRRPMQDSLGGRDGRHDGHHRRGRDGGPRPPRHRGPRHQRPDGRNDGAMPDPRERLRRLRERIRELRAEVEERGGSGGDSDRPRHARRMRDV